MVDNYLLSTQYQGIKKIFSRPVRHIPFLACILNVFLFLSFQSRADDSPVMQEAINDPNIHTVQFSRAGTAQSNTYPIIQLGTRDGVSLSWDVLGTGSTINYQYTIVHCDYDWHKSQMLQSDYLRGLYSDVVTTAGFSSATYVKYQHYMVNLPSDNIRPKISGNYVMIVYLDDPEKPVIVKRFYVYEKQVNIGGTAVRATDPQYRDGKHEINFTINTNNLTLMDPLNDIKTVIKQNWRSDNEISNLKPTYVNNNSLIYDYQEGNLFDAGNEFRMFDDRDLRYRGVGVRSLNYDSIWNVYLYPDEDRSYTVYTSVVDQDGNYVIVDPTDADASTTADYTKVHFKLSPAYTDDGSGSEIYVFGALTDWKIEKRFRMDYSSRFGYECDVLLKQGVYDYEYVKVKDGKLDATEFEGNHWETEDNYTVFVYYRPPSALGDLLVGVLHLNTGLGK